ncbi:MAG: polyphosphate polymerase domain-containing protein [Lachnospiraceae bacterium]|nr:polyphosphate polymerase domain-containing protein [Lachnospiraceae bacterium]
MDDEKKYRHEYKYLISDIEASLLKQRIKGLMHLDPHVGGSGEYLISSLYFDDYYDSCVSDNENGTDPREKFRIRIYNNSTNRITLECKRKERNKTLKTSAILTKNQALDVIKGVRLEPDSSTPPVLRKFIERQRCDRLVPKVIVEYSRVPFVYSIGNVRVTFDSQLVSSDSVESFLDGAIRRRPVMPVGKLHLEVKFDELLPDHLYNAMQLGNLTQTAFSKYYLCRKYGFGA